MVDNRLALKNTVEADLRKKIQSAQSVLGSLQCSVKQVEENSAKAKGEVNQAVQAIQQLIGKHTLELTRQIETICHKQISCLQLEIQSMYLALGSLQSTLSNLDSFDHTQLLSLHIPNVSTTPNFVPPPVELKLNNAALDEIKEWGSVTSNGLKGFLDVAHKSVARGSNSAINFSTQPKLSCSTKQNVDDFEIFDIERVLSGVKLQPSDADDFEIVSFESSSPIERRDSTVSEKPATYKSVPKSLTIMAAWQNEDASNDFSKWLKPKKSSGKENNCPPEKTEKRDAYIHNPLKNRFVDFPCLRTDPKSWIPAKRAKLNMSEIPKNGKIPLEYSRPAPFWLKKNS